AFLAGEISPVTVSTRKAKESITQDDGIRPDATPDTLGALRPAFAKQGTITAGNASQITDGAAALVIVSERYLTEANLTPLAKIESYSFVAGPDTSLHAQPANAIAAA